MDSNGLFYFSRRFCLLLNCNARALRELFLRLFLLPVFSALMFSFYFQLNDFQHSFLTRNGLLLNCIMAVSILSAAITAVTREFISISFILLILFQNQSSIIQPIN